GGLRGRAAFQSGMPGSTGQVSPLPASGSRTRNTMTSTLYQFGAGAAAGEVAGAAPLAAPMKSRVRRLAAARVFMGESGLMLGPLCRRCAGEAREQGLHLQEAFLPVLQVHAEAQAVLPIQPIGVGLG